MEEIPDTGLKFPVEGVVQIHGPDGKTRTYRRTARMFDDTLNHMVRLGDWEQWSFLNLGGAGTHPMHIHLVDFQVLSRDRYPADGDPNSPYDNKTGGTRVPLEYGGTAPISPGDQAGRTSYRSRRARWSTCSPASRRDGPVHVPLPSAGARGHGMMRPFVVMPREVLKFHHHQPGGHGHG